MTSDLVAALSGQPGAARHLQLLLDTAHRQQLTIPQVAYVLALAHHQSRMGQVMDLRTSGWMHEGDQMLGNTERGDGPRFRGRGHVPLTGRTAYHQWSHHLDLPLLQQPELAAEPDVAAEILVLGVTYGRLTGRTLAEFVNQSSVDYLRARRTVPDQSQAGVVAGYARRFEAALANQAVPPTPAPRQIRQAQRWLRAIGWPVPVDGLLTSVTRRAVADFQRGYTFTSLLVDGRPGEATMHALRSCASQGGLASPNFRFVEFASRTRAAGPSFHNHVLRVDRRLLSALERYRVAVGGPVLIALGYQSTSELIHYANGPRFHGGHDQGLAVDLANPVLSGAEAAGLGLFASIGEHRGLAAHLAVGDDHAHAHEPTRFPLD